MIIIKIIGIVGRAYYNKDNQEIIQFNEYIRMRFSIYDDVVVIGVLPDMGSIYVDTDCDKDKIDMNKIDCVLDLCDGFILPGGSYFYNFDEYVVNYAIKNDKPLLGICLGFQCLCSVFCKDRYKHDMTFKIYDNSHYSDPFDYNHDVIIKDGSLLKEIIGRDIFCVNSVHHYGFYNELDGAIVSAISKDGVIEGVEIPGKRFIIGVQWHPEYIDDDCSKRLFDSFVKYL